MNSGLILMRCLPMPGRIAPFVSQLTELLRPLRRGCGLRTAFGRRVSRAAGRSKNSTSSSALPNAECRQVLRACISASYHLPTAFIPRVRSQRIAMVDDVMSAGSALRGTYTELQSHGATPVVAGALMVLGNTGADFFAEQQLAVEAVVRENYSTLAAKRMPALRCRNAAGKCGRDRLKQNPK